MKHCLFTLLLVCLVSAGDLYAYDAQIGDLYYNLNTTNKTATVTYRSKEQHSSMGSDYSCNTDWKIINADIPSSVTYNGQDYTVTEIGTDAFRECSELNSVTIPNSVTKIGGRAFYNCAALTTANIGNSVTSLRVDDYYYYVFYGCKNLNAIKVADGNPSYSDIDGVLFSSDKTKLIRFPYGKTVAEYVIPKTVTSIKESAFDSCTGVTAIIIPSSMNYINKDAFKRCTSLTSVSIPNSVTSIGPSAFAYTGLTKVTIPGSVTCLEGSDSGGGAFDKCEQLKEVILNEGLETIGISTFRKCTSLISINIPNSVTRIFSDAFQGCNNLPKTINNIRYIDTYLVGVDDKTSTTYTIKEGTRFIGYEAFKGCSNMESITIPKSVISIDEYAFSGCTSLPVIDNIRYADTYLVEAMDKTLSAYSIKEGTKWIGTYAFSQCDNLVSFTIPSSVIRIGRNAFLSCKNMTSVTFGNSVKYLSPGAFNYCNKLEEVHISDIAAWCSIETDAMEKTNPLHYAHHLFLNDVEIKDLVIPEGVTKIPVVCFEGCVFNSITIPSSVTLIGYGAFMRLWADDVPDLHSFTCKAITPPKCEYAPVIEKDKAAPLYVPAGSVEAYKTANYWKEFTNIRPIQQAQEVAVTEVQAEPTENSVVLEWPKAEDAIVYTIEIKKNGELICQLSFNEQGQLLSISFAAPARNGKQREEPKMATQTASGWQYTISGLEANTTYTYTVTAKKSDDSVAYQKTITFTTKGSIEGIDAVIDANTHSAKVMHDGQLYILRDGKIYTATGAEVK